MVLNVSNTTQQYLNSLDYIQKQMTTAQSEASTGIRVQQASDDPNIVAQIFDTQTQIALNQQTQTNLGAAQTELNTADSSLQSAISAVLSAISIASQGASTTTTAQNRQNLAIEAQGLQQQLVNLSQTKVNGRYIFSGDIDTQPQYILNPAQPEGVQQMFTATATRTISDANGNPFAAAKTAQQLFDPQTAGAPAVGNTFNAINELINGLQTNSTAMIAQATTDLNDANDYLNQQLQFYGNAENQVSASLSMAQKFQIQEKSDLERIQSADLPTVALQLSQSTTEQQASLNVAAKIEQMQTVFNYLG